MGLGEGSDSGIWPQENQGRIAEKGLGDGFNVEGGDGIHEVGELVIELQTKAEDFVPAQQLSQLGVGLLAQGVLAEEFILRGLQFVVGE